MTETDGRRSEAELAALRRQASQRPERPADMICEAIGAAVSESLVDGKFNEFLNARGWALVHVGDGSCPEPPETWLQDGLDITAQGWIDPIGRLEELWRSAWLEGNQAGRAAS
jgi:hypothetical protein